jgi:hypothetical protein
MSHPDPAHDQENVRTDDHENAPVKRTKKRTANAENFSIRMPTGLIERLDRIAEEESKKQGIALRRNMILISFLQFAAIQYETYGTLYPERMRGGRAFPPGSDE